MKTSILSALQIFLISMAAFGQDQTENKTDFRKKFMMGLKIGGNYSNVYDSKGEDFATRAKSGWVAGGFFVLPINELIGVQPEILFSQKGFKGTGKILARDYKLTRTSNYLDIPIYLAVKPSEFITILGGIQYSYLFKQTDNFESGSTTIEQEQEFNNANIRKNSFGLVVGFDANMKHLVLGLRGGIDVLNNDGDGTTSTPKYRNNWIQFTIGYRIYTE